MKDKLGPRYRRGKLTGKSRVLEALKGTSRAEPKLVRQIIAETGMRESQVRAALHWLTWRDCVVESVGYGRGYYLVSRDQGVPK